MSEKPCFLTSHVAGPPHPVMYRSCNADKNWKNGKRGRKEGRKRKGGRKGNDREEEEEEESSLGFYSSW